MALEDTIVLLFGIALRGAAVLIAALLVVVLAVVSFWQRRPLATTVMTACDQEQPFRSMLATDICS